MIRFLIFLVACALSNCLKPHRFPDGRMVKFIPNINSPGKDLIHIEPRKATIVTINWMQNIMNEHNFDPSAINPNEDYEPWLEYLNSEDSMHIVKNISQLKKEIQNKESTNDDLTLLLAWYPKGDHGRNEILYIILCKLIIENKIMHVEKLIQSPFWDPRSIESKYLKYALEDLNYINGNQKMKVSLDKLYENDLRYKLAWSTWNLREPDLDDN